MIKQNFLERDLLVVVGTLLVFLLINFNKDLGLAYGMMMLLDWGILSTDSNVSFVTSRSSEDTMFSMVLAIFVYSAFILISGLVLTVLETSTSAIVSAKSFSSVVKVFAATTPALEGNLFFTFLSWGILAPIIETNFFFKTLLEWIHDRFGLNTNFNLLNATLWLVVTGISLLFAAFHFTAKGVRNNPALVLVFVFAVFSIWMIIRQKETKSAIMFHIIANSIAVLSTFKVI